MALVERRQPVVTPDDHGPLVAVATWFLMVALVLSVMIRVAIRFFITRALGKEDATCVIAALLGVGQSIAVSMAVQHGVGKRERLLSTTQLDDVQRADYAADLLYILVLALAKISVLQLLRRLAVIKLHQRIANGTMVVVMAWTIPSWFALAFRCGIPNPWDSKSGHCMDIFAFWAAIAPVDILTEIVIVSLPALMMRPAQVAISKKMVVIVAFIFRIFVIIPTIVRLPFLHTAYQSSDYNFASVDSVIITQCVMSLSVISACVPCLKPFLDGFDSGMMGVSLRRRKDGRSGGNSYGNTYEMGNFSTAERSRNRDHDRDDPRGKGMGHNTTIMAEDNEQPQSLRREGSGSMSSMQSDEMIIKRTDQWQVQYEPANPQMVVRDEGEDLEPRKAVQSII